jgi:hypothetical protein
VGFRSTVVFNEAQLSKPVHEKTERERVVPTISAKVSRLTFGITRSFRPSFPNCAKSSGIRASRFSLELKSWSTGQLGLFRAEYFGATGTVIIPLFHRVIFVSLLNCTEFSSRLSEVAQTLHSNLRD